MLYVLGNLVVDNNGSHGNQIRTGTIFLNAGQHPLRVNYQQGGSGPNLRVRYSGPDTSDVMEILSNTNGAIPQPAVYTEPPGHRWYHDRADARSRGALPRQSPRDPCSGARAR